VIERHVRQARAARLHGFIANWRGTGNLTQGIHATPYTPRLVHLLNTAKRSTAHGHPFDVWLSYEAAATILPASTSSTTSGGCTPSSAITPLGAVAAASRS
jgi:hypothetical protein